MSDGPEQQNIVPSTRSSYTPDRGPLTDPNPGERSALAAASGAPLDSLGVIPARGNRAGGGQQIDTGAQYGILLNLEFAAGGRAHRLVTGTFGSSRPSFDPKSGELHTSAAIDTNDPSLGPKGNAGQPAMPQVVNSTETDDGTTGNTGPDRRRDKSTS